MNIVFTIQHPAHVHLFRNPIKKLEETDDVQVVVRDKGIIVDLLEAYDIDHTVLADGFESVSNLPLTQLQYEFNVWRHVRQFDPDLVVGVGGMTASHVATLIGAKSLVFHDTEHATLQNKLAFPFADRICTPESYQKNIAEKQVRYSGYHELAYLHPDRFEPDPSILNDVGLDNDDRFVILRLVDWNAVHDIGDKGFDDIESVVKALEEAGARVYITAEGDIPAEVEHCQISVEPQRIHHLMYYADLFIGESATMATESAVLGTPAIFVSTSHRGYTDELEEKYGLVRTFSGPNRQKNGLDEAVSLLENYNPEKWDRQRKQMLGDKIDTTEFITDQINDLRAI